MGLPTSWKLAILADITGFKIHNIALSAKTNLRESSCGHCLVQDKCKTWEEQTSTLQNRSTVICEHRMLIGVL